MSFATKCRISHVVNDARVHVVPAEELRSLIVSSTQSSTMGKATLDFTELYAFSNGLLVFVGLNLFDSRRRVHSLLLPQSENG
jgi:hypothetical protein